MRKLFPLISIVLVLTLVGGAFAQVSYTNGFFTSYTVANLGNSEAEIIVNYYDANGTAAAWQVSRTVGVGGSVTIQQAVDDPSLSTGQYSAVVSSSQPVAAIVNQQLATAGSRTSIAPFSSYSGSAVGSKQVILPSVMYNWYGYYTEFFIQNVSANPAATITIEYTPTAIGSCTTGKPYTQVITSSGSLAKNASRVVSQLALSELGAAVTAGCTTYNGRFLGSAKIVSDQDIVVVVNQVVQDKLFTYNGFTSSGTNLVVPAYMRNWYGYYASLTIANPGAVDATVTLEYTPASGSNPSVPVTANHVVPAGKSINIYDGKGATAAQSDLIASYPYNPAESVTRQTKKFFGSVTISSTQPVIALVNQEAEAVAGNQAGSYNVPVTTEGSMKVNVPLIQSDYYGYYTSLTIMTVDGSEATVRITYTSDPDFSTVKNRTESYEMTTTNGFLNRYEGASCNVAANQCDLFFDTDWDGVGTTVGRFLGSATIEVISGSAIVAYVNSESNTAPYASTRDSMYTFNAFNLP